VEEFLRCTLEPAALGGTTIPAGEAVRVVYAAANRDPRRFAVPDLLDPSRPGNGHLGFGRGIRYCLGAALARAETHIVALRALLERFPRPALAAPPEKITWQPGMKRALASLPVRTSG
jgi:cytochrome P450